MADRTMDFQDLPAGDGVLVLSPRGEILAATLQAERLLRRRLEPGRILPLEEIFAPSHLHQARQSIEDALRSGASCTHLLGRIHLETDFDLFLKYSIAPLYQENRHIIGVVLTFHDDPLSQAWSSGSDFGLGVEPDAVFEHLDRGLFVINDRWRITAFNQRAAEITGFAPAEAVGRPCWDIFRADRCRQGCFLRATLEDGLTRMDQRVQVQTKEGRQVTLLVSTAPIKNRRGLVVGAVEVFQALGAGLPEPQEPGFQGDEVRLIGLSPPMRKLLTMLPDVAASEATVVIEGESGTGKDLLAQAIHHYSPRARGPLVAFSCSALVETLIESELFGHVKGAFTGAIRDKVGRFELARGGTLFLDEIGELKPALQAKLLRVLETRSFERVGSNRAIPLEARIISATSRNLEEEVRRGRFRLDLLYRLRTVTFTLPPLRERREDIPLLVQHCLERLNRRYGRQVRGVDPKVMTLLQQHAWPGNIRELERVLEHALVFVKGPVITMSHLPEMTFSRATQEPAEASRGRPRPSGELLAIQKALKKARGRREVAAQLLGISRSSLWRKMKAHGLLSLSSPEPREPEV